ncbi:electron transport complex subunit RsxG [Buchnera aphidicola (Muscaphis stroyani)]|uniref:Ion-translocating oxidoreductase complex subunit G n=1 Tax=Buchnera aphidicola (Muscaphis stroyani) TaxID=1241869 RepID=A0A4D6YEF0_9GAMM|nr:electron transport complex subunit RsxG [Buchnera aphidicola]QCI24218.1 electron transport complex subunit RsxG [Buchnera aphidicola (Muscaphis stroyani)]
MATNVYKTYKSTFKNAILISIISTFLVSSTIFIHNSTKNKILYQTEKENKKLMDQVIPKKLFNTVNKKLYWVKNTLLGDHEYHDLWLFFDKKCPKFAVIKSIAPDGYSGSIHMLISSDFNGKIIRVRILSHKETPGIGDKIELSVSDWINCFSGLTIKSLKDKQLSLRKYGGKIDQFTGATITPQAVTNAVKRTVFFVKKIPFMF